MEQIFAVCKHVHPVSERQSARGYAEFLYRPGAAWMNLGSASTSLRRFGPPETQARPKSCESRKTTEEIVLAISLVSSFFSLDQYIFSQVPLRPDLSITLVRESPPSPVCR